MTPAAAAARITRDAGRAMTAGRDRHRDLAGRVSPVVLMAGAALPVKETSS